MENLEWVNADRNNLILQTRFARQYGQRLGRFYRRASNLIRFLQVVTGSAAFISVMSSVGSDALLAWSGAIMAAVSTIDIIWQPGDLASQCYRAAERWGRLEARCYGMSDAELRPAVAKLQAVDLPTWNCLREPVFNDLMLEVGSDQRLKLGLLSRLAQAVT